MDNLAEFYKEFGARPETGNKDPLVADAFVDEAKSADNWKGVVERSKEKAEEMAQHISTIESLFKPGTRIVIETDSDGETLRASINSGGDERTDAVEILNGFLAECSKVRIPNKFYGNEVKYVRFPAVFASQGTYRGPTKKLFDLLRDTLASAKEVE